MRSNPVPVALVGELHAGRVERRAPSVLVVALQIVALAGDADGDADDRGPRVQPGVRGLRMRMYTASNNLTGLKPLGLCPFERQDLNAVRCGRLDPGAEEGSTARGHATEHPRARGPDDFARRV